MVLSGGHGLFGGWFFWGGGFLGWAWFFRGGVVFWGGMVFFGGGVVFLGGCGFWGAWFFLVFFGCIGYNEIGSMSGRYASYWNAFLFCEIFSTNFWKYKC